MISLTICVALISIIQFPILLYIKLSGIRMKVNEVHFKNIMSESLGTVQCLYLRDVDGEFVVVGSKQDR